MTTRLRSFQGTTLGSVLWLLCLQFFVAEQIVRLAWKIPYSMSRNYVSDLGSVQCDAFHYGASASRAVCSPFHALMNASFVLQGVLIFFGGLLVRRLFPAGKLLSFALFLIAISGIGVVVIGLAPNDVNAPIHNAAATEHFFSDNIGMTLLGAALLVQSRAPRWVGLYTLASGVLGLTATVLFAENIVLGLGLGGMERVAIYPFTLWLTLAGFYLLVSRFGGALGATAATRQYAAIQ